MPADFTTVTLAQLEEATEPERDDLAFGVIGLAPDGTVEVYNATESRLAGISPAKMMGVPFFEAMGQCMNNYLVAQRYQDEPVLDDVIPYVLTLRMKPTRVRLRMMQGPESPRHYLLIER
jgi:photoactive yellow protein